MTAIDFIDDDEINEDLSLLEDDDEEDSFLRRLQQEESKIIYNEFTFYINGTFLNETRKLDDVPFEVFLESDQFERIKNLDFSFDILDFVNNELHLKLNFESPEYISAGINKDTLVVRFKDNDVLRDIEGRGIQDDKEIRIEMRTQTTEMIGDTVSTAATVASAAIGANMVAAAIINATLNGSAGAIITLVK